LHPRTTRTGRTWRHGFAGKKQAVPPRPSRKGSDAHRSYYRARLLIRVMRTAVRKQITSFETFFSTLCYEFCHHLDCRSFAYRRSFSGNHLSGTMRLIWQPFESNFRSVGTCRRTRPRLPYCLTPFLATIAEIRRL
jgi:hypothetical protein